MATFDEALFRSENRFQIIELDATGDGGDFDLTYEIPPDSSTVSVLIEGGGIQVAVATGDEIFEPNGQSKFECHDGTRALHTQVAPEGGELPTSISLRGSVEPGTRVKISILSLFRKFKKFREPISCTACKRLLRFLLSIALTGGGAPVIDLDGDIPKEFWEWLQGFDPPDAIRNILEQLPAELLEKIIEAIQWLAAFLNEAFAPFDTVLTEICRRLGFCGDAA